MNCKNCNQAFTIYPEDIKSYEKMGVPGPLVCHDCRHKLRYLFRNERSIYSRKCDLCNRQVISIYSPDSLYRSYCNDCFQSDKWGAEEYGQDFDFSRPFFPQFKELKLKVPRLGLDNHKSENSEYSNIAVGNKNCYLVFGTIYSENSCYLRKADRLKECLDIIFANTLELCYECVDCYSSYNLTFSHNCTGCTFSSFLYDCVDCKNCFLCSNLRHAEYCWNNQQLSEQEYAKRIENIYAKDKLAEYKKQYEELKLKAIHRASSNFQSEDCLGDYLVRCKNCFYCFDLIGSEDNRYCSDALSGVHSSMECSSTAKNANNCYECSSCSDTKFASFCTSCREGNMSIDYGDALLNCSDCFACAGLRNKKFHIFNKPFSEEEYRVQKNKIIAHMKTTGEWGRFFPSHLSPFCYNESIVHDIYPLTEAEAIAQGFGWRQRDHREYQPQTFAVPDDIKNVGDEILKQILACKNCGKNYKIIPLELNFYRKLGLPIPEFCPDCRHYNRNKTRNLRNLYRRQCMKPGCSNEFETTYSPDRPEKVYCEECYRKEIY